jgi:hypothetical protein
MDLKTSFHLDGSIVADEIGLPNMHLFKGMIVHIHDQDALQVETWKLNLDNEKGDRGLHVYLVTV